MIAVFQFAKAGFFLAVAAMLLIDPLAVKKVAFDSSAEILSGIVAFIAADGSAMVPIATEAMYGRSPAGSSLPVLAWTFAMLGFWLVYIGRGMLRLEGWARRTRIGISAMQIVAGLAVLLVYWPSSEVNDRATALRGGQWRDLFVLVLLNGAIIFYMVQDVDVRHAFGVKDSQ